jgi:hypothetical protein
MGTWDDGLLDNDTACDGLGDLCGEIRDDIERFGDDPSATAELCAAVGVLLQLSDYDFDLESDRGSAIASAVSTHAAQLATLPAAARAVMEAVADGKGKEIAGRRDPAHSVWANLINAGATTSRFGERHAALFATTAGAAYVQTVADRCVAMIEDDMEREDDWGDMCREMGSIGVVGVLLVIAPRTLDAAVVQSWRTKAQKGIAELRERDDDELEFHEGYYANLDAALALLSPKGRLAPTLRGA